MLGMVTQTNAIVASYYSHKIMCSVIIVLHDGYLLVVGFVNENSLQIFMATIYGTGTTFTSHILMACGRFYFVVTDIAANGIFDDQYESSFVKSYCIR